MNPQLLNTLFYGSLAGLATILGIYLVFWAEAWVEKNSIYLISFASGVLLSVAFLNLIPEAQELSPRALNFVLLAFFFFYLLEHSLILHRCRGDRCQGINPQAHNLGVMSLLGIGLHSLIDGVVIALGFEISFTLGILATFSVILHEIPEGISTISILLYSDHRRRKALFYSYLVALATPLGAFLTYFWVRNVSEAVLGAGLAFAAGSFLYVAASDLIPEVHRGYKIFNIPSAALGAALPVLALKILGQ